MVWLSRHQLVLSQFGAIKCILNVEISPLWNGGVVGGREWLACVVLEHDRLVKRGRHLDWLHVHGILSGLVFLAVVAGAVCFICHIVLVRDVVLLSSWLQLVHHEWPLAHLAVFMLWPTGHVVCWKPPCRHHAWLLSKLVAWGLLAFETKLVLVLSLLKSDASPFEARS